MQMVFYPLKDVTLRGICDAFVVRDYSKLKTGLKIMSAEAFAVSQTSIITSGTLLLKASDVDASLIKTMSDLNGGACLDADVLLTLLANARFSGGLAVDAFLGADACTSVSGVVVDVALSGSISNSFIVLDLGDIPMPITIKGEVATQKTLEASSLPSGAGITATLSPTLKVPSLFSSVKISMGGSVSGTTKRFRNLGDLLGTALADLQGWNLGTYFYLEV